MYRRKIEKQTRSVKSVETLTLPELSDDNKRSPHLLQVQVYNSDAKTIHLVPTDYLREISLGTSSAMDMKFTTHRRPIWEPLWPS
jgi:hypothetical protein